MRRDLGRLTGREFDLLVIGGGIHGAAAVWDATQRGLAAALIEAGDFGGGTSWNSLKTVHGGLRHLQRANLAAMRESVGERRTLLRIAPALVRPLAFLVPTFGWSEHSLLAVGLLANDALSADRNRGVPPDNALPRSRMLSRAEVQERLPVLDHAALTGGALWHDAQVQSTERLLLAFLHAADGAGACVANYVRAVGLTDRDGRVGGVTVEADGGRTEVRARVVLNAAGPAVGTILRDPRIQGTERPLVRGLNLVVRRTSPGPEAVGMRSRGRYLFAAPWRGVTIVGTAYAPPADDAAAVAAAFLTDCQRAFPWLELEPRDVALVHQGLVPGSSAEDLASGPLLIDHEAGGAAGLVTMQGVKYTTARRLAERAVDLACRRLGRAVEPCRTASTPLPEAQPGSGLLEERAVRAVRSEMALHLDDALLRRLDLGTAGPPSAADVAVVARVMQSELGWSDATAAREIEEVGRAAPYRLAATMATQAGGQWTE